jgi:hypothetical protein
MIANKYKVKKYCEDYTKIENYQEALHSPLKYDLHHRREISENKSRKQLITENLYYGRPPEELVFLEHGEHISLHKANLSAETRQKLSAALKGEKCYMYGKPKSAETRQKMSDAHKGDKNPMFGKPKSAETKQKMSDAKKNMSAETRQRMSEAKKGLHWHTENDHRVWTE